jgi:hypothetical protein
MGSIAVPSQIAAGTTVPFATSATDNLDLIRADYTLTYSVAPVGSPIPGTFPIRADNPTPLGVAFDNVLTTNSSFTISVTNFIRSVQVASNTGAPQDPAFAGIPQSISARAYDAADNPSVVNQGTGNGFSLIAPAAVSQTNRTDFRAAPAGQNAGATMIDWTVTNAAVSVSNCPPAGCNGGVAPANPTSTPLVAVARGNESQTFQFLNPFTRVQFYYFDAAVNEWRLIGETSSATVTDNNTITIRSFTYTLASWDPPASLGSGVPARIVAVGVNAAGDALVTPVNSNILLTNP